MARAITLTSSTRRWNGRGLFVYGNVLSCPTATYVINNSGCLLSVIRIDLEGADLPVPRGAAKTIRRFR